MKIEFNTKNDSFEGERIKTECRRILADIAARIELGQVEGRIRDINGDIVGTWEL